MAVKLVAWNVEGRLTRFACDGRGSPDHIVESLRELRGDVVFLSEASDADNIDPHISAQIADIGYETHTVDYDDGGKEREWAAVEAPNMKLLTRLAVTSFRQLRLGDMRNALVADVVDPDTDHALRVYGIHLDDRSENYRLRQMKDLVVCLEESRGMPTVVMGDYNAMHASDPRARFLRSGVLEDLIKKWPSARTKDVLERLTDMARGDTLAMLEEGSDLIDIDGHRRQPTTTPKMRGQEWLPSIPTVQIDHMYISPEMRVSEFTVGKDGGSDHRPISATVEA